MDLRLLRMHLVLVLVKIVFNEGRVVGLVFTRPPILNKVAFNHFASGHNRTNIGR